MADYTPVFTPGSTWTSQASATITGGQLLEVTGSGTVGPAGAASVKVVGVAGNDAASGAKVTVHTGKVVHEAVNSGGVTAGDSLASAAAGQVATVAAATGAAAGTRIGIALTTATTGNLVRFVAL